jgi:predicted RNase H-like HicB family nuclease
VWITKFAVIIEKETDNYSAYCPDLPGVIATGRTTEETIQTMKEAILFHLEGLKEENIAIPEPTTQIALIEVTV